MEGSDQVARNEWMCIFHAKEGAQGQGFKAELTPRCGGIYGRNRWEVTFDLQGLFSQEDIAAFGRKRCTEDYKWRACLIPCRLVFEKGNHHIPVTGGFLRKECQKLFSYRTA